LRYAYNTRYGAPVIPSLNVRWQLNQGFTLRASYANGFRAPSLKELYLFFVDVNHDIVGNEDLDAERSHNLERRTGLSACEGERRVHQRLSVSSTHVVDDLISLAQIRHTATRMSMSGQYHTAGGSIGAGWDNGHWVISCGAALTGRLR
jgi:outer membrane receptor for ferrienterochelin and colicins